MPKIETKIEKTGETDVLTEQTDVLTEQLPVSAETEAPEQAPPSVGAASPPVANPVVVQPPSPCESLFAELRELLIAIGQTIRENTLVLQTIQTLLEQREKDSYSAKPNPSPVTAAQLLSGEEFARLPYRTALATAANWVNLSVEELSQRVQQRRAQLGNLITASAALVLVVRELRPELLPVSPVRGGQSGSATVYDADGCPLCEHCAALRKRSRLCVRRVRRKDGQGVFYTWSCERYQNHPGKYPAPIHPNTGKRWWVTEIEYENWRFRPDCLKLTSECQYHYRNNKCNRPEGTLCPHESDPADRESFN